MRSTQTIIRYDWVQFSRSKAFWWLTLLLLAIGVYGAFYGRSRVAEQQQKIAYLKKDIDSSRQAVRTKLQRQDTIASWLGWYDALYVLHSNPPDGVAALSFGQRDLHKFAVRLSIGTFFYDKYAGGYENKTLSGEIANPQQQAAGHLDVSFVLVFLLPLYFILLSYNILSSEREGGTLLLLAVQQLDMRRLVFIKLALRVLIAVAAGYIVITIGALVNNAFDSRLLYFFAGTTVYVMAWAGMAALVVALKKSSGVNALLLIASWLLFAVAAPAAFTAALNVTHPTGTKTELAETVQKANARVWGTPRKELAKRFYTEYPQYNNQPNDTFPGNWYNPRWVRATHLLLDREVAPYESRHMAATQHRIATADRLDYCSPALLAQSIFNRAAASDAAQTFAYDTSIYDHFVRWRDYIDYRTYLRDDYLTREEFENLPRDDFRPQISYPKIHRRLFALLLIACLLFLLSFALMKRQHAGEPLLKEAGGSTSAAKRKGRRPERARVMKRFLLLLLSLQVGVGLLAQNLSLSGTVTSASGMRVRNATVSLQRLPVANAAVGNTLADSSGYYRFTSLQPGRYFIVVSSTGYRLQQSDTITVVDETPMVSYSVTLQPVSNQLEGVVIKNGVAPVQVNGGTVSFNLANQAVTAGQTAFDVLKKLPGVGIDQNENILLRGAVGVNVMVDGKMTYLSGTQLTNYLKGLAAEDLSRIELMATPGAAFDAAGNSGVIQIITKKRRSPGYAVDIRSAATWSKWWLWNENVSASLRTQKWNLFGSFDYNTPHRYYDKVSGNSLPGSGGALHLQRVQRTEFKIKYYTYRAGADWQFQPKHTLSLRYHGYFDDWTGTHFTTVNTVQKPSNRLTSFIRSSNVLVEPYHYDAPSVSYRFELDTSGKRITADADYTSYRNYSDGLLTTQNFRSDGNFIGEQQLRVNQPGFIRIKSLKLDAELPFKHFNLSTGLKWAEVENDNAFRYDSLLNGRFEVAETMSNHFRYKEKISAAYVSVDKVWRNTRINAGLRIESTNARGYTEKGTEGNQWKYTPLFPSGSITQQMGDKHELSLSASRRINRPTYSDLNPVRWYSDQYFYFSGNPRLVPELGWVYAASYSLKKKYVLAVSYNRTTNFINRLLVLDGTTIKSTSANLGSQRRLDITASVPVKPTSFWSIQAFTDVSHTRYPISLKSGLKELSQWANTTTLQQSFNLSVAWTATFNTNFYSSELRGIYLTRPTWTMDVGFKKQLLQSRLTLQGNCNDVLNSNRYKAFSQTDITDYFYNDKPYSRQLSVSLTYHLGGNTFRGTNRRTEEQQRL